MSNLKTVLYFTIGIFASTVLSAAHSEADKSNQTDKSIYEVITRQEGKDEGYPNFNFFVIKKDALGKVDKTFHEIECFAKIFYGDKGICSIIKSDDKLLLSDCFHHSTISYSCRLVRYNSDGTLDSTFKAPFSSSFNELIDGSPEHEIKNINEVKIEPNGTIRIEGKFISPLVGWSREQASADAEIGDLVGKDGIVLLKKDGTFNSFIPKKNR